MLSQDTTSVLVHCWCYKPRDMAEFREVEADLVGMGLLWSMGAKKLDYWTDLVLNGIVVEDFISTVEQRPFKLCIRYNPAVHQSGINDYEHYHWYRTRATFLKAVMIEIMKRRLIQDNLTTTPP